MYEDTSVNGYLQFILVTKGNFPYLPNPEYQSGQSNDEAAYASDAVDNFRAAAERGDKEAQYALGLSYLRDVGVRGSGIDPAEFDAEAAKWFRKAAEQGHAASQFQLGYAYEHGRGAEQAMDEAKRWYRRAAHQGHPYGQESLGRFYLAGPFMGYGVKLDVEEAAKWLLRAGDESSPPGKFLLGGIHEQGIGVEKDYAAAYKWYLGATEGGYYEADDRLVDWYRARLRSDPANAYGLTLEQAVDGLRQLAWTGHVVAQRTLGLVHEIGLGTAVECDAAKRWYREAAAQGDPSAMLRLKELGAEPTEQND